MTTLAEFMEQNGIRNTYFDDPNQGRGTGPFEKMRENVGDGDFKLTRTQQRSAEMLAGEILDFARNQGVDITQFSDIQRVMGFDNNAGELSTKELAAYLVGQAAVSGGHVGFGGVQLEISPEFRLNSGEAAIAMGQQAFGDNNPEVSSADTLTPQSFEAATDALPRARC
jgi:hypothetical protein